jgi:hypothetical protein
MVWDNGAPAVGTSFPRVIDNARLIGVPQAGRTDSLSGYQPYKHDVLDPASLPPCSTADDAGAQHIPSGAGVDTPPTWTITLTMPVYGPLQSLDPRSLPDQAWTLMIVSQSVKCW